MVFQNTGLVARSLAAEMGSFCDPVPITGGPSHVMQGSDMPPKCLTKHWEIWGLL